MNVTRNDFNKVKRILMSERADKLLNCSVKFFNENSKDPSEPPKIKIENFAYSEGLDKIVKDYQVFLTCTGLFIHEKRDKPLW